MHLRCNYGSRTIEAHGTPSSALFSFRRAVQRCRQSPLCSQDSAGWERLEVPPWWGPQAVARAHAGVFTRPDQGQWGTERTCPVSLFAESPCRSRPASRRVSAPPVLLLNGNSGSSVPFFGTTFSPFSFLLSPPRFLLQLSKMPTSSCRLTMPGWQLTTSEPSKSNAFKSYSEKGGENQSVQGFSLLSATEVAPPGHCSLNV